MRNLKYAILGLVNRSPMTGYDLLKCFEDDALSNFWHAKHSQIYPELNKLVEEGKLTYETVLVGEKLEKKLYTITEDGQKDFLSWLASDYDIGPTPKDAFRLRMFFSDEISTEDNLRNIRSALEQHTARLDYLQGHMEECFSTRPEYGTAEFGDFAVLDSAIRREQAATDWLRYMLTLIH